MKSGQKAGWKVNANDLVLSDKRRIVSFICKLRHDHLSVRTRTRLRQVHVAKT